MSDGSIEFRCYTTEAGVDSDAQVDSYRWIDYWFTDGSNHCRAGITINGTKWWSRFSENTINSTTATPSGITTAINISSFLPVSRVKEVLFGGRSATTYAAYYSISGVSGTAQCMAEAGYYYTSDGDIYEWNVKSESFIPITGNNIYWGDGTYDSGVVTIQLSIHAVKLKR